MIIMYDRTTELVRSKAIIAPPSPPGRRTDAQGAKFHALTRTAVGMGALFHPCFFEVKSLLTEYRRRGPKTHFELSAPSVNRYISAAADFLSQGGALN